MSNERPLLAYIAGKYRGPTAWAVEQNIRRAEELGFAVAKWFIPVIPHSMFRYFNGTQTDEFWLEGTLEIMRRCDVVILLPDWIESAGATAESKEAWRLGIPVVVALEPYSSEKFAADIELLQKTVRSSNEQIEKKLDADRTALLKSHEPG